jgi:hypothetical protein
MNPMDADEYKVDKSTWGAGAWQDEPDRVDFVAWGFAALALRHPAHGHWCGYVGVPAGHPLYEKEAQDIEGLANFHGGINYTAKCSGLICHTPGPGMPDDVWWIGGDFGHWFDLSPGREARWPGEAAAAPLPARYCELPYVRAHIERLALQLRCAAGPLSEAERMALTADQVRALVGL